jgi:hypothetical protein
MRRLLPFTALAMLTFALFSFSYVSAIEDDSRLAHRPSGGQKTIRCESQKGRHEYCYTYTTGQVRLERQLSNAPCRRYDTWGADRDGSGIWVRDGCRAIFVVEGYRPYPDTGGGRRTVTCKSEGFKYKYCRTGAHGRVRLERQLSDTRCHRGDNWGVDRNGIWVDGGCGAVFSVD